MSIQLVDVNCQTVLELIALIAINHYRYWNNGDMGTWRHAVMKHECHEFTTHAVVDLPLA